MRFEPRFAAMLTDVDWLRLDWPKMDWARMIVLLGVLRGTRQLAAFHLTGLARMQGLAVGRWVFGYAVPRFCLPGV